MLHYNQPPKRAVTHWVFAAALLSAAAAGCSRPTATVSGQVTFQKQPLPAGSITFMQADGTTKSGSIREGRYSIDKVPTGPYTVLVVSMPPLRAVRNHQTKETEGASGAPGKSPPSKALPIPPRYNDLKQSDLHYEVMAGNQTYDIDLKP